MPEHVVVLLTIILTVLYLILGIGTAKIYIKAIKLALPELLLVFIWPLVLVIVATHNLEEL